MSIIQRTRWRSQPQAITNPSALIGRDALLWSASTRIVTTGARNLVSSSEVSPLFPAPSHLGLPAAWTRAANAGVDFGIVQPLNFTDVSGITIAVVGAPVAAANRKLAISFRKGTANVEQTHIGFNTSATTTAASGNVTLYTRNTAAAGTAVTVLSGGIDGGIHCWVAGNSAARGYIYRDGVEQSLSTSTRMSGAYVSAIQKFRIAKYSGSSKTRAPSRV